MIQLVSFDLDGTLLAENQAISPRVQQAIAAAQAQGMIVTLATGRMFDATLPFARQLHIRAPLICGQGSWVQADGDTQPRHRITLAREIAAAVLDLSVREKWHAVLYADGRVYLSEQRYDSLFYASLLGEVEMCHDWQSILDAHQLDKVLLVAEPQDIPAIGVELERHWGNVAEVMRSHANFIEVVPAGVNKGVGLAWLAAHLGIPREAVMAMGDHENDLAMVKWAGVGVAMGNAIPAVKAVADWVAPDITADGAAVALERFVLAPPDR